MKTTSGNIFKTETADTIVIPTNGFVKKDGSNAMGKGSTPSSKTLALFTPKTW